MRTCSMLEVDPFLVSFAPQNSVTGCHLHMRVMHEHYGPVPLFSLLFFANPQRSEMMDSEPRSRRPLHGKALISCVQSTGGQPDARDESIQNPLISEDGPSKVRTGSPSAKTMDPSAVRWETLQPVVLL
ncbi:uncharacterized protein FOMMEDRAFT_19984 [Fomitiporia mediterranea MF3/22]|uniref:uncharacterized protein n=1 Tax=Fomitiporia mediterranea (strain MF3/22) TaxID=694068 RepID=UPI000440759F|nr:uncharacterized protein FOMMEDRAFT_19984 [Fomitiporia mediterranea MF3/22]EJD02711.1 hypothetical protein FOMMEDRAFT_19984 [Fomitiporia mediterranea MF3/22]